MFWWWLALAIISLVLNMFHIGDFYTEMWACIILAEMNRLHSVFFREDSE